jgi:hypothetical protein
MRTDITIASDENHSQHGPERILYASPMDSPPHRIGPALAMVAAILAAALLASLAPFHMSGDWNRPTDAWQRTSEQLLEFPAAAGQPGDAIDADTLVVLEALPGDEYAFAANTVAGGLAIGVASPLGYTMANSIGQAEELAGEFGSDEEGTLHTLWVMRAPGTEAEFRYRLHTTRGAY